MKKKELIEYLKDFKDDAIVFVTLEIQDKFLDKYSYENFEEITSIDDNNGDIQINIIRRSK